MPKVTKAIAKLKHPNSRKTFALAKQMKRTENRQKKKKEHNLKVNIVGEKIQWFKDRLLPDVEVYTPEQTEEIIETYLARFDEELEQIVLKHSIGGRKNRQHASREDIIRLNQERERQEYETCGIEIPDLLDARQMKLLRTWNGELKYLQNFKLRRIGKPHLEKIKSKTADENLEANEETIVSKTTDGNLELTNSEEMIVDTNND